MARTRANILCSIWDDPEFISMPVEPQRLYLYLLSQRDLSHAGLVPLRLHRWSLKIPGGTVGQVSKALAALTKARFVLVDRNTEEVLVRTYVRNDGVYKQPKVMLRMREDARLMESIELREAFAVELTRLPLDELAPSTRTVVEKVVKDLLSELRQDTLPDTHSEGYPIPPRAGAGALHQPPTTIHQLGKVSTEPHQGEPPAVDNAPPIQPCGESHPSAQACRACGAIAKQEIAEALAAKTAADREAVANARAEREADAAETEAQIDADPEATDRARAKARAALKSARTTTKEE